MIFLNQAAIIFKFLFFPRNSCSIHTAQTQSSAHSRYPEIKLKNDVSYVKNSINKGQSWTLYMVKHNLGVKVTLKFLVILAGSKCPVRGGWKRRIVPRFAIKAELDR